METIIGTRISAVTPSYEHIYISVDKPGEGFYISSKNLVAILSEFDFEVGKKIKRRWGKVDIEKYRVERFNEHRTY
jgi:hypothetical protein